MANHKIEIRRRNVEKILLSAEKVFAEKGYGGTSMGDIAEEVELPRSNLHYYFSTKDDLYRAVLLDLLDVWKQDALARRHVSRPLIVGDHVVVGDVEGYVHLLNRETGAFAARDRAGSEAIAADPVPFGRGFVVQDMDGDITAYEVR